MTSPERFLTQPVSVVAFTRVMRGGKHRCIRSHCMAFDATPCPPACLLPRSLNGIAAYQIVLAGEMTGLQEAKIRKMHRVRQAVVRDALSFYKENNACFDDVAIDENSLTKGDHTWKQVNEDLFIVAADNDTSSVDKEGEGIAGSRDDCRATTEEVELEVIERSVGFVCTDKPTEEAGENAVVELTDDGDAERRFLVRHSSIFSRDTNGNLYGKMFPHLFPFGRGHPGEPRKEPVSHEECVKYYMTLSSRRFSEDETFAFVAFDRVALEKMYIQNSVRCRRCPGIFEGFNEISRDELAEALEVNEQRRQGRKPPSASSTSAMRFLKSVEVSSSSVWGSAAERRYYRQQAFAYQARYGQPTLFVTLTPNSDNSFVTVQYSGNATSGSLWDSWMAKLPTRIDTRKATMGDDAASARLFVKQMDAFVEDVLGIDPVTNKKKAFEGLLGPVRAYFGMVETQGRGTLHGHFLIWLSRCPPNAEMFEKELHEDRDNFLRELVDFGESIVTTEIPLPLESAYCAICGESFGSLEAMPIPPDARRNIIGPFAGKKVPSRIREPALVRCAGCSAEFSSQHVLRRVVLSNCPVVWPPPLRQLTQNEFDEQVNREVGSRSSRKEARNIIYERESLRYAASGDSTYDSGSAVLRENGEKELELLHHLNETQAQYCRLDDDAILNSEPLQWLSMMLPSRDDERVRRGDAEFMISALALRFNLHWWSHTNSCFKESKAAPDGLCRYNFPRDRENCSYVDDDGFHLKRGAGFEYMNGFNWTLMGAFRCNHDVQILLGGSSATDRIYYCCKYVAKPQRSLDSVAVVALTGFQKRLEKEETERRDGLNPGDTTTSRRRVASMAFNVTNRQEIAGPLAVLYLLRGSCCFKSNDCCQLPLREILKQLRGENEYSCRLVGIPRASMEAANRFRTASVLDDYLQRPRLCDDACLYEFAARCFRRLKRPGTNPAVFYLEGHPLYESHCVGLHESESVPMISGYQIPKWNEDGPLDKKADYASAILVLFQPFRRLEDLLGNEETTASGWVSAYLYWREHRTDIAKEIMGNLSDYYCGKEKADKEGCCVGALSSQSDYDSDASEADGMFATDVEAESFTAPDDDYAGTSGGSAFDRYGLGSDTNTVLDSDAIDPSFCPTVAKPNAALEATVDCCLEHNLFDGVVAAVTGSENGEPNRLCDDENEQSQEHERLKLWIAENGLAVDKLQQWIGDINSDSKLHSYAHPRSAERRTEVVELLEDALNANYRTWEPINRADNRPDNLPPYASLQAVSHAYTLNEKQHVAFCKVGEALFNRWRLKEIDGGASVESLRGAQLRMFLGGEGGTGKSRVIEAIETLCCSWGRPTCIIKTALTGKATAIIGGRTLASFILSLENRASAIDMENLDIVVVDEVSMIKKSEVAKLDRLLRKQKRMMNVPFGGLPPVRAVPLYVDPTRRGKWTSTDIVAFELWRTFKTVVILEESVRFRADPEWGRGCKAARRGTWTKEFVDIINSRVVPQTADSNSDMKFREATHGETVFTSPENATRAAINNQFIVRAAAKLSTNEYPIRVVANFKGALQYLSKPEIDMVMNLPDSKFGRMAPFMDLIPGMPIQITQNVRTAKGVANGTLGVLVDVVFKPSTAFRTIRDTTTGTLVSLPSQPPVVGFVRIARGSGAISVSPGISSEIFPLLYTTEAFSKCKIKLAPSSAGTPRVLEMKIQQFPFVCAVGSTVYKVQGETLNSMVVVDWKSSVSVANKPQQSYLLVSRVTSRYAFMTLKQFTPEIAEWSKPPQDALDEEDRLIALSEATIRDFFAKRSNESD